MPKVSKVFGRLLAKGISLSEAKAGVPEHENEASERIHIRRSELIPPFATITSSQTNLQICHFIHFMIIHWYVDLSINSGN